MQQQIGARHPPPGRRMQTMPPPPGYGNGAGQLGMPPPAPMMMHQPQQYPPFAPPPQPHSHGMPIPPFAGTLCGPPHAGVGGQHGPPFPSGAQQHHTIPPNYGYHHTANNNQQQQQQQQQPLPLPHAGHPPPPNAHHHHQQGILQQQMLIRLPHQHQQQHAQGNPSQNLLNNGCSSAFSPPIMQMPTMMTGRGRGGGGGGDAANGGTSRAPSCSSNASFATSKGETSVSVMSSSGGLLGASATSQSIDGGVMAQRFKTHPCATFETKGKCKYSYHCMFAHGAHELRTMEVNIRLGLTSEETITKHRKEQRYLSKRAAEINVKGFLPFAPNHPTSVELLEGDASAKHLIGMQMANTIAATTGSRKDTAGTIIADSPRRSPMNGNSTTNIPTTTAQIYPPPPSNHQHTCNPLLPTTTMPPTAVSMFAPPPMPKQMAAHAYVHGGSGYDAPAADHQQRVAPPPYAATPPVAGSSPPPHHLIMGQEGTIPSTSSPHHDAFFGASISTPMTIRLGTNAVVDGVGGSGSGSHHPTQPNAVAARVSRTCSSNLGSLSSTVAGQQVGAGGRIPAVPWRGQARGGSTTATAMPATPTPHLFAPPMLHIPTMAEEQPWPHSSHSSDAGGGDRHDQHRHNNNGEGAEGDDYPLHRTSSSSSSYVHNHQQHNNHASSSALPPPDSMESSFGGASTSTSRILNSSGMYRHNPYARPSAATAEGGGGVAPPSRQSSPVNNTNVNEGAMMGGATPIRGATACMSRSASFH